MSVSKFNSQCRLRSGNQLLFLGTFVIRLGDGVKFQCLKNLPKKLSLYISIALTTEEQSWGGNRFLPRSIPHLQC